MFHNNMTLPTTRQRMVQAIYIHSIRSHIATRNTRACHREGLRRKATCRLFRLPALTALTDSCVVPAPGPLQHEHVQAYEASRRKSRISRVNADFCACVGG